MNAATARALSLAAVVLIWTAISHLAKLPLQLWPVLVGLACFVAAGGGTAGLQKSAAAVVSGVIWSFLAYTISRALGRHDLVDAIVLGAAVFGMVFQARVPPLSFTAGALAGAGVAMGARVVNVEGGLRIAIALVIGTGLGYAAEYGLALLTSRRSFAGSAARST
jgi:hypothetical protein